MRVLYLSHFGGVGGAERSLLEMMVAVRELGVEPILMCPAGPLGQEAAAAGIPVEIWCAHPLTRSRGSSHWRRAAPRLLRGWRELDQTVWQYQPHILHVNNAQAMLWSGPAMRFRGPSVVWHLRDFLDFPRVGRLMARHTDAVVAVSKSILTFAADMLGPSARRLVLVRNGIADLPPDHAGQVAAVRRDLGVTPDAPLVVMAGQSVPRKGHAVLLQALARLATARPDLLSWLLCIEHDLEASSHTQRLRRQAAELGCGRGVRITEGVAQISPVLRAANVVVVPSLREPFGRIAVEAMLAERPVIASAVDGLNEIVAAGATGILVPPGNPARLAAALASVLDAPTSWEARGRAARRRALRLFSVSRMADEMVSLYRTVRRG